MKPLVIIFLSLSFSACSLKTIALRSTVSLLENGTNSFYEESDLLFAEQSLVSQLKLAEILLQNDPFQPQLVLQAAQGFGAYSFLFLEEREPERARIFYDRGAKIGLRLLEKKSGAKFLRMEPNHLERVLSQFKKQDVPLLFWTAYCWGGLIQVSREQPELLAQLPAVLRIMQRVQELDPNYFYGGPSLFLGSYYGAMPAAFGGDSQKSKTHFEKAVSISQRRFLMGLVLYAQYVGIPAQRKDLFKSLLAEVVSFNLENFPEQRLSNTVAQERAKRLLENADEFFE
ncbi:MAG: hypothetical protein HYY63_00390 [Elusimicrobia bacterium]|nr:hypothetical protein [Elusimicrobiota bacterium]